MQLRGLRSAQFRVGDVVAAKAWYTTLFGIEPYYDEPYYVGFEIGGYEFGLMPGEASTHGALFLWATEDPEGYIGWAIESGASPGMKPQGTGDGIVVGTFVDPFGNEFGVIRNPHFSPQLVHAAAADVSDAVISHSRDVPVARIDAWNLWASSEGLAKWWTPHTKVDLRPGGAYEIHFRPEQAPGDKGGDWCRVLSFLPGQMLSFTWNAPPELRTRPLHTWVVLTFEGVDGATRVTLNHLGWPDSGISDAASDWPATLAYFREAWSYVMDLFAGHFEPA